MKYLSLIKGLLLTVSIMASSSAWSQTYCGGPGGIPISNGPMAGLCSDGSPPRSGNGGGGGGGSGGYVPPKVVYLPTSYGAVAWNDKTNTFGYSSKQASKQASSLG